MAVAAGVVWDAEGAEAPSAERMLAEALEANRLPELAEVLIEDNALGREQVARLAERDAERNAGLERLRADFRCAAADGVRAVVGEVAAAAAGRRGW
jgi:hypothetical protein